MYNAHSFTHRNQTPLTIDEIAQRAPSALATRPYKGMSTKYSHIATLGVIQAMLKAGFQPFSATQSCTRVPGKGDFTKHMLRFRHEVVSQSLAVGEVIPEVVLINSHDGTSAYKLIAGLYRLVCSNGLMVSDGEIDSISVTHKGDVLKDVIEGSYKLIDDTQKSVATVRTGRNCHSRTASSTHSPSPRTPSASRIRTARSPRRSPPVSCSLHDDARTLAATCGTR
jgi:Domain of unknown function (DUF932)